MKSYAKINLTLEIIKKRSDGFHELKSIMQLLSLYDEIDFSFNQSDKISIISDSPMLPLDERNICFKACTKFFEITGLKTGIEIKIQKNIPMQGGLGGGSSNAALTLKILNEYFNFPLNSTELNNLAKSIGADVPFFLSEEKTALLEGIGEIITPLKSFESFPLILFFPKQGVSTKEAYQDLELNELKLNGENTSILKQALEMGLFKENIKYLHNDFEQSVYKKYPEFLELKEKIENEDSLKVLMSGSGSTIFAFFENAEKRDNAFKNLENECRSIKAETL